MGSIVKKGLQKYMLQLQKHPLRTKALTAAVMSGLIDSVAQKLSGIPKFELRRVLLKVLFGFAYGGPFGHYVYIWMDKIFKDKKDKKTVAKKVVLDQLILSPWSTFIFMIYYGLVVEGRKWNHVKGKITKDLLSTQLTSWTFWPAFNWLIYQYVPMDLRMIAGMSAGFCWGIFMTLRARSLASKKG